MGTATPSYITTASLNAFIGAALQEDIGEGDHSSLGSIDASRVCTAQLIIKEHGILAGVDLAETIFSYYDVGLNLIRKKSDGEEVAPGTIGFLVEGSARSILTTERLVLNCMQRMSGIATYTNRLCRMLEGTSTRLMDTRKTTPNFRIIEKWAVAIGGGQNHRLALYDMVMLKDNHVDMAGGIARAIEGVRQYLNSASKSIPIEIETRSLDEVREVIETGGVDVIMLDNMSLQDMTIAVKMINHRFKTEASGGITETTIRKVAECGIDFISVGALTHSVKSLDISLKVIK